MSIFHELANEGKCIILVTHSPIVAESADVVYELIDLSRNKAKKKDASGKGVQNKVQAVV